MSSAAGLVDGVDLGRPKQVKKGFSRRASDVGMKALTGVMTTGQSVADSVVEIANQGAEMAVRTGSAALEVGKDLPGSLSNVGSVALEVGMDLPGSLGKTSSIVGDGLLAAGAKSISMTADVGKGIAGLTKVAKNPLRVDDSHIEEKVSLEGR